MRRKPRLLTALVLAVSLSCRAPAPTVPAPAPAPVATTPSAPGRAIVTLDPAATEHGKLTLAFPDPGTAATPLAVTALDSAELAPLFAQLAPLPAVAPGPAMRAPSAAPAPTSPVTPIALTVADGGTRIPDAPPSPVAPPAPAAPAPLAPPELAPAGEVEAASEIYVRFAEAMVPVAEVGVAHQVPAVLTPSVPGSWRWIDTRVARFTAVTELPKATDYTITVPAGTRALSGAVLGEPVIGRFSTPPIAIDRLGMRASRPDAALPIVFDQPFDPIALAKRLRVEHRSTPIAFDVATLDEAKARWARDPRIRVADLKLPANTLLIVPRDSWPAGANLKVVLGKGAPSREGTRVTTKEDVGQTSILAPFTLYGIDCDRRLVRAARGPGRCPANRFFSVQFSNPVGRHDPAKLQIIGEPLDAQHASELNGRLRAPGAVGKTFTVEAAEDLTDEAGQTLTGPRTARFVTRPPVYDASLTTSSGMYVLDPRFEIPQWKVEVAALAAVRIQLYRAEPADYFRWKTFEDTGKGTPPGKLLHDQIQPIGARQGAIIRVDLRPALVDGVGHVIAVATPRPIPGRKPGWAAQRTAWIQVTRLGITARLDGERVHSWVHQIDPLHLLAPRAGVTTSLLAAGHPVTTATTATDGQGRTTLELPPPAAPRATADEDAPEEPVDAILLAAIGGDSTFEAIDRHERSVREQTTRWYTTDDRFTYRPGETVYVKGWVRWSHTGVDPDLELPGPGERITYTLTDDKNVRLGSGTTELSPQGGFDLQVAIPSTANLGTARFLFESKAQQHRLPIQIEEFRTPTFEVAIDDDVRFRGARPLIAGEAIEMTASAKYYSGGGLAGARVKWAARLEAATYQPPGWEGFSFAPRSHERFQRRRRSRNYTSAYDAATLSGASSSTVAIGIAATPLGEPAVLQVDATVIDLDRTTIRESSRPIVVHPSAYYVGVRTKEASDDLELVVTDLDGKLIEGVAIEVAIEGVKGDTLGTEHPPIVDTQACSLQSGPAPVTCAWKRRDLDTAYAATARIRDARGRSNATRFHVPWWKRQRNDTDFDVVADKAAYRPGEVAKLELTSAIVPATAIVSLARQGVISQRRIELTAPSTIVEIPIEPSFIRNVHVLVDRISRRSDAVRLPETTNRELELRLEPEHGRLQVTATPAKPTVGPGDPATFEVQVRHRGKPVAGAEVALLAVDEAVLAVSGKVHADPLAPFYFDVEDGTEVASSLGLIADAGEELQQVPGIVRIDLDGPEGEGFGMGAGRGGLRGRSSSVPSVMIGAAGPRQVRKDFRATAVWAPRLATDAQGRATVTVKMPDSLTRFRIVALATASTRYFGKAESAIATQRPLNVRATAPRFLSQGDRFSLPVVVQNLDATPRTVEVGVRAANLIGGPAGQRVTIPGGQRAELRFDFRTNARGRAVIQTIAVSGELSDASQIEVPIYEPVTTVASATYGIVDADRPAFEQLVIPDRIVADVGGVEAELFASELASLSDAYWYLQAYPYECAEQRSSRMLASAALGDVLDAFAAPNRPTAAELAAQRDRDLRELERDQKDGGWGYFYRNEPDPFVTQQVVAALAAVGAKGAPIERGARGVAKASVSRIARLEALAARPATNRDPARLPAEIGLAAAELATLGALERRPELVKLLAAERARSLALALRLHRVATRLGSYPLDARARVLALVAKQPAAAAIRRELLTQLRSAAREDASAATITTSYSPGERLLLVSNAKTTALVLDAMIREAPEHPLIPKLARGLLAGRKRGRWGSTQENLAVVQALRRYFETYEKTAPDFTARVWLGGAGYVEHAFRQRDARAVARVGWDALSGKTHSLALAKAGAGRLYYRIGVQYAPAQHDLPPIDAGFVVRRSYHGVEDPRDVTRTADGQYRIRLGALVRIELEVITTARRHAVALVDPLPAGFEPINARLATAERTATATDDWDHVNARDNRSEAFAMELPEGRRRFGYTVRANTPGTFLAAAAKAEEMYAPETFGRTANAIVTIE